MCYFFAAGGRYIASFSTGVRSEKRVRRCCNSPWSRLPLHRNHSNTFRVRDLLRFFHCTPTCCHAPLYPPQPLCVHHLLLPRRKLFKRDYFGVCPCLYISTRLPGPPNFQSILHSLHCHPAFCLRLAPLPFSLGGAGSTAGH